MLYRKHGSGYQDLERNTDSEVKNKEQGDRERITQPKGLNTMKVSEKLRNKKDLCQKSCRREEHAKVAKGMKIDNEKSKELNYPEVAGTCYAQGDTNPNTTRFYVENVKKSFKPRHRKSLHKKSYSTDGTNMGVKSNDKTSSPKNMTPQDKKAGSFNSVPTSQRKKKSDKRKERKNKLHRKWKHSEKLNKMKIIKQNEMYKIVEQVKNTKSKCSVCDYQCQTKESFRRHVKECMYGLTTEYSYISYLKSLNKARRKSLTDTLLNMDT